MRSAMVGLLVYCLGSSPLFAAEKPIDPEHSSLIVHVGKSGFLSAAGHEHTVLAPIADGTIDDDGEPRVRFRVVSNAMMVLLEEHQEQVQRTMQERVLESGRFPEIAFYSETIKSTGDSHWIVTGKLILHGESRTIQVAVSKLERAYVGQTTIRQTDFGILPVSVAGGTVKVKNELTIGFTVVTK